MSGPEFGDLASVVVSTVFVAFDVVGLIPASGAKLADDVASW